MSSNYITVDGINHINAELSNYCNAACPMCARFDSEQNLNKDITNNSHTTLEVIKNKIGPRVIKNLWRFRSCGNVGDGTMNPECAEIYDYVKSVNQKVDLSINTNGGARNKEFYKSLAEIGVRVIFSIDGLEDTNHLYRRNVKWSKLFENVESFINAGGTAHWDFLVFKHNQHQIDTAEQLSKKLGFSRFNKKATTRWDDFDAKGTWLQRDKIQIDSYALEKPENKKIIDVDNKRDVKVEHVKVKKIKCHSFSNNNVEIFLHANGYVTPCCWLGDLNIHGPQVLRKFYAGANINLRSLEEILGGTYFKFLAQSTQGRVTALRTCENVCGIQ